VRKQLHNTLPYRLDKTSLQYQGHTVWNKRCSALVSGRTHYSLCPQVNNPFSKDYQRILHLKLYKQQLTPFGSLRAFYSKETGVLNVLESY
jgi:hypothetical protein